ncbi:MAG: 3-phosphoshikimate 1-carboxyvinyltransferase [Bdellovibrionaceae bacterium]|nr:3-phosphoshikimate 1-carboxyvinyltransferase [Pseudobdellovibrionaceae bacterium]
MTRFQFRGDVPASKSFYNRAMIARSFFPELELKGTSDCDDVRVMQKAVACMWAGETRIPCGEAGTVFRFMAFRVSRQKGDFLLTGSPRLLARPQKEILRILPQLGAKVESRPEGLWIRSAGWLPPRERLRIRADESSQFVSGLLLSAWNLPFNLEFEIEGARVSNAYWEMTQRFLARIGLKVELRDGVHRVAGAQVPQLTVVSVEPDFSSAFPLAVAGSLWGETRLDGMGGASLQPDAIFPSLLESCGAAVVREGADLIFRAQGPLKGRTHHLLETPDLFPVLAVAAAFSEGESFLGGAPHLVAKESDRLAKTRELLSLARIPCSVEGSGLRVQGQGPSCVPATFSFNPDQDHRMAMAAGLLKLKNQRIEIQTPDVVGKSYPGFWRDLGTGAGLRLP